MNRNQKISLYLVISITLAAILFALAFAVRHFGAVSPKPFFYGAAAVMAIGVFFVFRTKPDQGPVVADERDKLIEKNAQLAGFGAVYLLVIIASFAPIAIFGEDGSLPANWCPALLVGAAFCQAYAQSWAVLIQYGRADKEDWTSADHGATAK
jgi:drug/metabolite transporter (DMT)-like permease